jgi:hypothetical protein
MSKRPDVTSMLSVYSGTVCLGHLLNRGKLGWEAIDTDDRSLGVFPTQQAASDAISARLEQAAKPRKRGRRR